MVLKGLVVVLIVLHSMKIPEYEYYFLLRICVVLEIPFLAHDSRSNAYREAIQAALPALSV